MTTVFFDLDGTLVDSVPGLVVALNALLAEEGRTPCSEADLRAWIGHGAPHLLARAAEARGGPFADDALPRFVAHAAALATVPTRPYDGIPELLDALPRPCGLVTNKPIAATRALLDHLGWADRFAVVLGGDSLPTRKPDPASLLAAADALGVAPAQAVFVGDSDVDEATAAAAGTRFVGVAWGYGDPGPTVARHVGELRHHLVAAGALPA